MAPLHHVQKRDGSLVDFEQIKITEAIWKAAQSVGGTDRALAEKISGQVTAVLEVFFKVDGPAPTVEQIQDLVEKILIEDGHAKTAKAYILYREEHKKLRAKREEIMGVERLKLKAVNGENKQLGDFIVLDIEDDLESIFEGMKETVIIHQNNEIACVNFSLLRPHGASVKGLGSASEGHPGASGPIAFMKLYDTALNTIKSVDQSTVQHVILLSINHPDILDYLSYEQTNGKFQNFNLMVEVTPEFMEAVENRIDYGLVNPSDEKVAKSLNAAKIYELLMKNIESNIGPKPIVIEYPEKHRKHSSIQVNLPFDEEGGESESVRERHAAQEVTLPPIQTLA